MSPSHSPLASGLWPLATSLPDAHDVAETVRARIGPDRPILAIILGSGLGGLASRLESTRQVPYHDIPGFAPARVSGHEGVLLAGTLAGRAVIALSGRFHVYEGHPPAVAAYPVRVLHAIGAEVLLVSNASGGIRRTFRPGDLMVINDHVNLSWANPLAGPLMPGDERFPDMSEPYDRDLRSALHNAAESLGVSLQDGVYGGLSGPSYETAAEVRMLERLGIDAVGMSTVPEVIVARANGMRVAGVSCITNIAAGMSLVPVRHEDVLRVTAEAAQVFEEVVIEFVRRL